MTAPPENTSPRNAEVEVYNLDPAKTPGRMKVRWRIRTATGKEAQRLEKQQNQVILRLLTWADKYLREQEEPAPDDQENTWNVSRETTGNVTVMSPGKDTIRNERHNSQKGRAA